PIITTNFGPVHTVAEALRGNPPMFAKHVASNLMHLPGVYAAVDLEHSPVLLPGAGFVGLEAAALAVFVAAIALRRAWRRLDRLWPMRMTLVLLSCYVVPSLLVAIVVYPMEHYVIIAGTLGSLGAVIALASDGGEIPGVARLAALGMLVVALTPQPS